MERWEDIENYEGYYRVSDMGQVKSLDRFSIGKRWGSEYKRIQKGRILIPGAYSNDYLFVALSKNGIVEQFLLHRLVAFYFVPNPNNYPDVNHKKGNKKDNRASELEWCTKSQNMIHAIKTGLFNPMGESNGYARKCTIQKGDFIKEFPTQRAAALFIGVPERNVGQGKTTGYKVSGYSILK